MTTRLNYQPSDLAYYTTWWLTSKPSISSQTTSVSTRNSIKSDDIQQNIDQDKIQASCCIPIKKFRTKR